MLSNTTSNEFRVTYQRERNVRGDQPAIRPFRCSRSISPTATTSVLGTENSSQANKLNQDIVEVNDDVTLLKGKHTITIGTHNEFFHFYNLFIQNIVRQLQIWNGPGRKSAGKLAGRPRAVVLAQLRERPEQSRCFRRSSRSGSSACTPEIRGGRASNFTLTYGVRFDAPHFPDTPHANPLSVADFGLRTDVVPSPKMWSPRVGFNWDLSNGSDNRQQIRGGVGIVRRPHAVRLAVEPVRQHGRGLHARCPSASTASNKIPFVADPNAQPTTVTGGTTGKQTINMIDPNYKIPAAASRQHRVRPHAGFWGLSARRNSYGRKLRTTSYTKI